MIVVAGGSGLLGRLIVTRLQGRGERIVVLVRDVDRARSVLGSDVGVISMDVRRRKGLDAAVAGADVVISAVHGFLGGRGAGPAEVDQRGNANLIDAAAATGARFVLVSVSGAAPDHPLDLFRAKYAAEQYAQANSAPWTIVRAPAYIETWLAILTETAGSTGRPVIFGRGDQPIPFTSADDVADLVSRAVSDRRLRGRILEVTGELITMNQLAQALQEARHWNGPLRHLPRPLLRALAIVSTPVKPAFARQNRAALMMDRSTTTATHTHTNSEPAASAIEPLDGRPTLLAHIASSHEDSPE
ncbi:SDR family oxidoreductase [Leifsonia sp. NPDC058292]|uniref:SDR family oxidoreductase n=1 Tax=Leifsonia sp. NPDC058292 TaxID=3346428 RepID=UPI0036DEF6F5